jgi:hypothetical protein
MTNMKGKHWQIANPPSSYINKHIIRYDGVIDGIRVRKYIYICIKTWFLTKNATAIQ